MATLKFFKNYNNYFNRIVKHDYLKTTMDKYETVDKPNINFDEQDGLYTETVVNWTEKWTPNYLMVDPIIPNIEFVPLVKYLNYVSSTNSTHQERWGVYEDVEDTLVLYNLYDATTKTFNITNMVNRNNQDYGYVDICFDFDGALGYVPLNMFSFLANFYYDMIKIHVYDYNGTGNDEIFEISVPKTGIINAKEILKQYPTITNKNAYIESLDIIGSSPDSIWGTMINNDYNTEWTIDSSWFILEWKKIRLNQYRAILKRDVIADNYNEIIKAPTYIEKANITDVNDPLIFNSEGMAFNQIKQSETPLKDETDCGWVVGYIPSDWAGATINSNVVISSMNADITVDTLSSWDYFKNVTSNSNFKYMSSSNNGNQVGLKIRWCHDEIGYSDSYIDFYGQMIYFNTRTGYKNTETLKTSGQDASNPNWPSWGNDFHIDGPRTMGWYYKTELETSERNALLNQFVGNSSFISHINNCLTQGTEIASQSSINALLNLRSKIIKETSTNTYYRIDIKTVNSANPIVIDKATTTGASVFSDVSTGVGNASGWSIVGTLQNGDVVAKLDSDAYAIELTQISINCEVTIDNDRFHLSDNPYDMFCIPYSNTLQIYDGEHTFTCIKDVALNIAEQLAGKAGSASVYDVQILPYCPARHVISGSSNPSVLLDVSKAKYDNIVTVADGQTTGYVNTIIWCMSSSFTFDINKVISVPTYNPVELKVSNECDMYRLSSGNFNGVFEFSPAKSYGINGFKVECTYKPFNPYIHVTPKLKGLYGSNYTVIDDMRGLICGGDFSLPQLSNTWANYELSNKNYQQIFDRTIQNLDVQYDVAKQQALIGAITGTITGTASGGVSGAITGSKLGGGYGAIAGAAIGAIAGGGASLAGGIADYQNTKRLQEENRDFQTDLFNYNLQNIQAIPSSLTKSSALTFNTRIWPFLEYYTCTDDEKNAFRNKLKYNGMTVMKIDTISNYIYDDDYYFLKGKLIRLDNVNGESGMVAEIYNEIYKGIYI